MIVFEKLKLNKFVSVSVPRNRDLYARVGGRVPELGTSGFTADYGKSKMESISDDISFIEGEMLKSSLMTPDDYNNIKP